MVRWLGWAGFFFAVSMALAAERMPVPGEMLPHSPMRGFPGIAWHQGDNVAWARPDFDDQSWKRIPRAELPSRDGIYWVRFRVRLPENDWLSACDSVSLSIVASYDIFWDGHLLGSNGRAASNREDEVPGLVDNIFRVPDGLCGPGEHIVAMRISSFRTGFPGDHYTLVFRVHALRDYMTFRSRNAAFMMVAAGGALVVALVFGLMWLLADRRPAVGLFGAVCFAAAMEQGLQAWRVLAAYPYDWHYPRMVVIALVVAALGLLLVGFLQAFFRLRHGGWRMLFVAAIFAALWPLSPFYNNKATLICWCALSTAVVMASQAWRGRGRGAGFIFGGLLLSVVGMLRSPADFLEQSFVFTFGPAMLGCVIALTLELRDDRRAARQAQLTASRLEVELLKKNIQPHFLLNTLATLQEVIEQEPKTAMALVEALASEFRLVNRMSGEKLVTLGHELELCRAHLHVMSLRKGARCTLQVIGADDAALVPPALFLTLIENGLTHLLPRDGQLGFTLRTEYRGGSTRYALLAEGVRQREAASVPVREGTGLRYIKARLEESFTGCWTLTAGPVLEGWETVIELGHRAARSAPVASASVRPPLPNEQPA